MDGFEMGESSIEKSYCLLEEKYMTLLEEIAHVNNVSGDDLVKSDVVEVKQIKGKDNAIRVYVYFTLTIKTITVNDHTFLAVIDHLNGNMITEVPNSGVTQDQIRNYYDAHGDTCDFCNTRRARNKTFIVMDNGNKKTKQIGSNCLKLFLGGRSPAKINEIFSLLAALRGTATQGGFGEHGGGKTNIGKSLTYWLAIADYCVSRYGFHKKGSDMPTTAKMYETRIDIEDGDFVLDEKHFENAKKIIDWASNLDDSITLNDNFMRNMKLIASDRFNFEFMRHGGFVAYMPVAYMKSQDSYVNKEKEIKPTSNYVGVVGEKISPTLITVVNGNWYNNMYGAVQMVIMEDSIGNVYKWMNTSKMEMEVGVKYVIVGTIKQHDEYNNTKQTVLTRVKAKIQEGVLIKLDSVLMECLQEFQHA